MRLNVLYFAAARERAGTPRETVDAAPGCTVRALLELLGEKHPPLRELFRHVRVAVNQEFAQLDDAVPDGAEIALIPPVAGGAGGLFRVQDAELSLDEVVRAVGGHARGGLVTFTGVVRDQTRGKAVVRLEYEAYAPMAEKKLAEIGAECEAAWPGVKVAIVHRIGVLTPGMSAVVIAASAPHRKEAFRACEKAIDRLKEDVPIWKKEIYADGEVWVGLGP